MLTDLTEKTFFHFKNRVFQSPKKSQKMPIFPIFRFGQKET